MDARDEIARLVKEAAAAMKSDVRGGLSKLEGAYVLAQGTGDPHESSAVAKELARGWAASLTKDPEDKRWLLELASDASRQGRPRA